MFDLKTLRESAGGLSNLTDEEILQTAYPAFQRYYPSMDDFAKAVGYSGAGRGMTGSRMSASVDNFQASLYDAGSQAAKAVGATGLGNWAERNRRINASAADYAGARAKELGAIDSFKDVTGPASLGNYAAGLAIGTLPQVGAMGIGAAGGFALGGLPGAAAGAVAAGYPSNVGSILSEQREQTRSEANPDGTVDMLSASALGVPYSAVDALTGVGGKLFGAGVRGAAKATADGLGKRVLKGGAKSAAEEAAGETFQTGLEQVGRMQVDPNETFINDKSLDRFGEAAVGGGLLGGIVGGASGVRSRKPVEQRPPVNDTPGESTDLLSGQWTTSQGFDPAPPAAPAPSPLGDLTPDWTTAPGAGLPTEAAPGIDPTGLYRAADEPPTLGATGSRGAKPLDQMPAVDIPIVADVAGTAGLQGAQADALYGEENGDPGLAEARRRFLEMQVAQEAEKAQRQAEEKAAQAYQVKASAAYDAFTDKGPDGQPTTKLKHQDIELHDQLMQLQAAGQISPDGFTSMVGQVKAGMRMGDKSAVNAVRTVVKGLLNPKPEAPAAPAQNAPAQAPQGAQTTTPAQPSAPAPTEPSAPATPPEPPSPYAKYAGRSVAVKLPNPQPGKKPIKRTIRDAGAALQEADDRVSKFEALAKCLQK